MKTSAERYISLLKSSVMNQLYVELEAQLIYAVLCASHREIPVLDKLQSMRVDEALLNHLYQLKDSGDSIVLQSLDRKGEPFPDDSLRNYTEFAHTLLGRDRLDHLEKCIRTIFAEKIQGDFLQAGCWRGGSAIFLQGLQHALGKGCRKFWIADSFQGLPKSEHAADQGFPMDKSVLPFLNVDRAQVESLFQRYDLWDENIEILEGWFEETLNCPPIQSLSLLHIDADLYSSTKCVLESCYQLVTEGGFVVIDDYGKLPPCKEAVDEFLAKQRLAPSLEAIGEHAVGWRVAG